MRKQIASFLVSLLALSLCISMASCENAPTESIPSESFQESSAEESSEEELFGNLPDVRYDGENIVFLVEGDYMDTYKSVEIVAQTDSYEALNNAINIRNDLITEKYGVTISEVRTTGWGDMLTRIRNDSLSGTSEYDILMPYMGDAATLSQEGILYDLNTLENIHLDREYYDQSAVSDLSILGKNYFATGDLSLLSYDVTHILVFDKDMVEQYGLESPYDLVKNGTWTIDKLWEMAKKVTADTDGEDGMGCLDTYGFLVNGNFTSSLFIGAGQRFTSKNNSDEPVVSVYSEASVAVFDKIFNLINDESASGKIDCATGGFWRTALASGKTVWEAANEASAQHRALFHSISLNGILALGEFDWNFGLLPAPKYDESQEKYYSRVSTIYASCVAIPLNARNAEMSSIIVDAMMQASTDTVDVAYFDVIMKERKIQDYESEQILDLIFDGRVYDFGSIYNWGYSAHGQSNFLGFMDKIAFDGTNTFVSTWESIEDAVESDIQNTVEAYRMLG